MKKIISLTFLLFTLSACGTKGIDKSNPESSVKYIKQELSIEDDIERKQEEYPGGIRDIYVVGDNVYAIVKDNSIEEINFSNIDENDIQHILEIIEFSDTYSINKLTEKYYTDIAQYGSYDNNATFTNYEDFGVRVVTNLESLKKDGDKPFSLWVYYDSERYDEVKELSYEHYNML